MPTPSKQRLKCLFIVGAGFSSAAGLPLTTTFTSRLLALRHPRRGPSGALVRFLRAFVHDGFDHSASAKAKYWPALEDLFTCVDLAANSGHHLGGRYSPSDLRTVRRALIVRTIDMIRAEYSRAKARQTKKWQTLDQFFAAVDVKHSAFISMNWDTVIEDGLARTQNTARLEYGSGAIPAEFSAGHVRRRYVHSRRVPAHILKLHGSINWLYCDNCRDLFWFPGKDTPAIAEELFRQRDWDVIYNISGTTHKKLSPSSSCPSCAAASLGTRLATFSYRKALDFPMYQRCWLTAEELLRDAATWVFIGYSMPAADYEFKYLLKKVQLARATAPPRLLLITGGTSAGDTYRTYQRFFGRGITRAGRYPTSLDRGLNHAALRELKRLKLIR